MITPSRGNPMPHSEFWCKTEDGLQLYAQNWQPEMKPQAAVCLIHGLGEHSGRYSHVARFLNKSGYTLIAIDLRGHGKSEGRRGHTPSYETLMNDISHLLQMAKKRYPDCPLFLYGHSLGGNLVINYALRSNPRLNAVIASAPLLRTFFDLPIWKMAMARIMRYLWPTFSTSNGLNVKNLSRDARVVHDYQNDPLVHDRVTTCFLDIRHAGLWALEYAAKFSLPLLLMHGDADRITSPQASREFAAKMGDRCTLKIFNGLYHEIHNEPESEVVFSCLSEWLQSKM